ncbi:MAG: class I SAM-dependent methyltransferase [Bacteroidia bacterium]|nr:class I SAM-dependent methyltransferase [Bacteroidia bacterium]
MRKAIEYTKEEIFKANIDIHTVMSSGYNDTEPHFRSENIQRVSKIIASLQKQTSGTKLLDIGCGTGFIINIARDFFKEIRGIDITPAMLEQVDTLSDTCDIGIEIANSEDIPYPDNYFEVVTAHALLHHLPELKPTLNEVYRVLRPSGIFYSDLDPNAYFWETISSLPSDKKYHPVVRREIEAVYNKNKEYARQFNIDKDLLIKAEPLKHINGGFYEEELIQLLDETGFKKSDTVYEWFLGEANIIHGNYSEETPDIFRKYLKEIMPLSRQLYKYISIRAIK